ncbi:MAG: pilus assembly protein TadG-related protein [Clostridiaceae bacterium]|nr:pilus assembly protein TadG-related protein [Clostridiaceae bacterium]
MNKDFWKEEKGASLILLAFAMTAFLALAAIGLDIGTAYLRTAEVQTAADAAVMAAGLQMPVKVSDMERQNEIKQIGQGYLQKNGVSADDATFYFAEEANGLYYRIGVDINAVSETSFARIFGTDTITFSRGAEARAIPCVSLNDIVPLSVEESKLTTLIESGFTEHVVLKYGSNTEEVVEGSFGAIDLDGIKGGGANDYLTWLNNGFGGYLNINDILPVEHGNMTGPTLTGVMERYNACTHYTSDGGCNENHYVASCPRVMKVPVIVYTSGDHSYVKIVGFAAFVLEDYTTYATEGYVIGSYVDTVNVGSEYGDLSGSVQSFGVYSLTLSR